MTSTHSLELVPDGKLAIATTSDAYNGSIRIFNLSNGWDGGHDVIGIPNERKLLISTDLDLHGFDVHSTTFETGSTVVERKGGLYIHRLLAGQASSNTDESRACAKS
ncbi:hypothetical protein E4U41_007295 [Claviceps citrina]|nr:hypothetical protein E4U41_007295 [Claviceps citrina]